MKRYRDRGKTGVAVESGDASTGKEKMWAAEQQLDAGMDELFAVLGYKVKSSDMAGVAEKLEQLEMAMGSPKEDGSSLLSSTDTVHYNPSDLSGWVESMLSELNNTTGSRISGESSGGNFIYDDDLRAIPGGAILSNSHNDAIDDSESGNKRVKSGPGSPPPRRPVVVVVVDSQEAGVRLVHTLMACAEAVQREDRKLADALVQNVGVLAASQAGAMRKVATYFAKALARKIYKIHPGDQRDSDALQTHFYETAPYLKFAHFTANQAILEAFAEATRVHVIDFSLKHGMQWPALMQALALRPGGPPAFRLTGIGPPQPDTTGALQQVGMKLAQLAEAIGLAFEFRVLVVDSLAEIEASTLDIRPTEAVAVNSVLELHRLLSRPGAMDKVLDSIKGMNPNIVTIVEQEANHNGSVFLDRFNEALHYYSAMFDSLQSSGQMAEADGHDLEMTDVYLGQQICNVVACEGAERVERHEALAQWRRRMDSAGFGPVHLGSNAFREASMMLAIFGGGDGYEVEENEGCLMLGWHTRPLIATSAWRVTAAE